MGMEKVSDVQLMWFRKKEKKILFLSETFPVFLELESKQNIYLCHNYYPYLLTSFLYFITPMDYISTYNDPIKNHGHGIRLYLPPLGLWARNSTPKSGTSTQRTRPGSGLLPHWSGQFWNICRGWPPQWYVKTDF